MKTYASRFRHFTFPIGIWAGPKSPVELSEGKIGEKPQDWPLDTSPYRFRVRSCVVIDGKGVIRGFYDVSDRFQEAKLWRHVRVLLAEPTAAPMNSLGHN